MGKEVGFMNENKETFHRNIHCVPDKELVALEIPEKKLDELFGIVFARDYSFELAGGEIIIFPPETAEIIVGIRRLRAKRVPIVSIEDTPPKKLRQLRRRFLLPR